MAGSSTTVSIVLLVLSKMSARELFLVPENYAATARSAKNFVATTARKLVQYWPNRRMSVMVVKNASNVL